MGLRDEVAKQAWIANEADFPTPYTWEDENEDCRADMYRVADAALNAVVDWLDADDHYSRELGPGEAVGWEQAIKAIRAERGQGRG